MPAYNVIPEIITGLSLIEAGTTGITAADSIKKAFDYAPNAISPLPCFINFYDRSEYKWPRESNGIREGVHYIRALALVALQSDSAQAERVARPLMGSFVDRLDQHKTLDSYPTSCEVIEAAVESAEYGPVSLHQSEQPFLGVSFTVAIRTFESVTYRSSG